MAGSQPEGSSGMDHSWSEAEVAGPQDPEVLMSSGVPAERLNISPETRQILAGLLPVDPTAALKARKKGDSKEGFSEYTLRFLRD